MIKKLEQKKWKVISSEYISREPWFTVRRECVELPSGVQVPTWYVLEYPDWVNIIAITNDDKFVMVSQYRHALGITAYELPAGTRDATDASALEAAQRELSEETGYGNGTWQLYTTMSANPTSHNNLCYTFLATGVEKISPQHTEPTEDISVHLLTYDDVRQLLETDGIVQALHAAPLWKYVCERERK